MRSKILSVASALILLLALCSCELGEGISTTTSVTKTVWTTQTATTTQTQTETTTVTETTMQTVTVTTTVIPVKVKRTKFGNGLIEALDIETEYLPVVVASENPEAPYESMKAQVIAARTYAFYKMLYEPSGQNFDVYDSETDQVYNPEMWDKQTQETQDLIIQAVRETYGIVLKYADMVVCSCYVSGKTSTYHYVTFNEGKSGNNITQTTLINSSNPPSLTPHNRGCMGQIQANDLAEQGYVLAGILQYFYGADIIMGKYNAYY